MLGRGWLGVRCQRVEAVEDGFGLEDHAFAAAEGPVVDGAVAVVGKGAEVVGADVDLADVWMARLRTPWVKGRRRSRGRW